MKTGTCEACGASFVRSSGRGRPRKFCTTCVPPGSPGAWRKATGYDERYAAERRGTGRERSRAYYVANREAILERARRYREKNREAIRARDRRYDKRRREERRRDPKS